MVLGITFYSLPNDTIIGFVFLFALFGGALSIRAQYALMHRAHSYPNDQLHLVVRGGRLLKLMTIPMMVALLALASRVQPGIEAGKFWQIESVSRGWWCVIRICIGGLAALCASVFDAHWLFRAWASLTVPLCTVLDLMSQSSLAVQISCIEHGLCGDDQAQLTELYRLSWRDILSAWFTLMFCGVSTWLWFMFGVWRNDLHMPRFEHRIMKQKLDKIRIKPKEIRRKTDDENQLEKMLGY